MVVLNRIYTRTGDEGMTMLGNGEQRKKYDLRVSAYGMVDEVTAAIGVARLHTAEAPVIDELADSGESVSAEVRSYINRLSDFLFVASRYVNDKGARDVLWIPGANR